MSNEVDNNEAPEGQESEAVLQKSLQEVLSILTPLSADGRNRILTTVATFFGSNVGTSRPTGPTASSSPSVSSTAFSEDRSLSPKEFMLEKLPQSDVERMVCLAYYLTHYRDTPYFKTIDLSKLSTEAAQRKFSNAAAAARNAAAYHYLAPAPAKGKKQLSAAGEMFVQELPDRAAAKAAMASVKPRKPRSPRKKSSNKKKVAEIDD